MRPVVEPTSPVLARARRLAPWLLLILALGVAAGLYGFWSAPPQYYLWVNGAEVAEAQDEEALKEALSQWAADRLSRAVALEHGGQAWTHSLAEMGMSLPLDEAEEALAEALGRRKWWQRTVEIRLQLEAAWDRNRVEAVLAPIREAVERPPVPARIETDGPAVTIIPSVDGARVDADALDRALRTLGVADRLDLPVAAVRPDVDTAAIEGLGIRRQIAAWSTRYDPSIPRAENVERAASAFAEVMLAPGEVLSYNETVGPIDAATGWKEAYVIVNGELVPGIGGGVCQVSTTLYGAALRANLEIVERHPHQLAVAYVPPSEDAAIAQGYQDLKIRNTTPGHLLIKAEAGGGTVTFRLYGDLPPGQEVRIESKVTGSLPFSTRVVPDPTLPPGEERRVRAGIPGITSEAYRLVYVDGELVRRELLSRDRYLPTAAVVRTGPEAPPPDTAADGSE